MSRSILKSAIFLAFASAVLGVIMYAMGAVWTAVIEVSACSGLVTVIFISAISLSKMPKEDVKERYDDKNRMKYLPVILIAAGVLVIVFALAKDFRLPNLEAIIPEDFKSIFWNTRQLDILGQIIAILVGGITVSILLRENEGHR
jgi:NADH:ubiquinone oxidoreductase subunit 6 (subunit J)